MRSRVLLFAQFLVFTTAIVVLLSALCALASSKTEFRAKNGTRVKVLPAGKAPATREAESRIEFYSPQNKLLCALDYSSEDGEHGFGVVKASFTPDNMFFVYSLTSSGGHQAWHAPTLFFGVKDRRNRNLDTYAYREGTTGVCTGDFRLGAPSVVVTEVCTDRPLSRKYDLRKLSMSKERGHALPSLSCADGKIIAAEPSDLVSPK